MIKEHLLIEAYRKVCNYDQDVDITPKSTDFSKRMIEEYMFLNALDEFENTQPIFLPKPVDSAKQIALQTAVEYHKEISTTSDDIVETAKLFYQYLTEPVTDKP